MKFTSGSRSRQPFTVLRRVASFLPLRYRCVALLIATLMFFPLILLAMGVSALLQSMSLAVAAVRRVYEDGLGRARATHLTPEAELAGLPAAATVAVVTVPSLRT